MSAANAYGLKGIQLWPTMIFTRTWEHHGVEGPKVLAFLRDMQAGQGKVIDSSAPQPPGFVRKSTLTCFAGQ